MREALDTYDRSAHELSMSFLVVSALPPTQRRFMSATTAAGAKGNLDHYTLV